MMLAMISMVKGGEKMSMDALKAVTDSEEQARAKKAQAEVQAKALVEKARKTGEAHLEEARRKAQAEVRDKLAQAEAHGEETTRQVLAQYAQDCETLKAQAGRRLAEAADLIMGKVVDG